MTNHHGTPEAPSPVFILLAGEYADTEILGVTFAVTQEDADRTAHQMTHDRVGIYSGDLVQVRAERAAIIRPDGGVL